MNPQEIQIADYVYDLPDDRIARHPLAVRDSCKLLVANSKGVIDDTVFTALPELLPADAMLVYNNTRVINARVILHKATGAAIEIFCLEPVSPADYERMFASTGPVVWRCLVGNSKRWKEGTLSRVLDIPGVGAVTMHAVRKAREEGGASSLIEFSWDNPDCTLAQVIEAAGVIPIPPYLNRETEACDSEDYQTIFSRIEGSVAAPTAGLHFTDRVLADIDARGIRRREVTLHVGAGTFRRRIVNRMNRLDAVEHAEIRLGIREEGAHPALDVVMIHRPAQTRQRAFETRLKTKNVIGGQTHAKFCPDDGGIVGRAFCHGGYSGSKESPS